MPATRSRRASEPGSDHSARQDPAGQTTVAPGSPVDAGRLARRAFALADGGHLLVASDFDGTLAWLVSDPWGAAIVPAARRALRRLAGAPHVSVVLISGRTVPDLAARVRVGGARYLGDHGAEWATARRGFRPASLRVEREPASAAEMETAERLRTGVPRAVGQPWLIVEPKGSALTFHFRSAPDVDAARASVLAAVDDVDPEYILRRSGGRRSLELRPAGASDKGRALARVIAEQQPGAVVMLGDDATDALAFEALREARLRGDVDGLAVAVAGHPDVRARAWERADDVLGSPGEVARFLACLADLCVRTVDRRDPGDGRP
jgi:trehalose 6-phosphate phosphatase